MLIGDKLRNLLEEKEISQKRCAEILGVAPSTLGNWIRNEREIDYKALKKFAAFFSVSTDYLLEYNPDDYCSIFEENTEYIAIDKKSNDISELVAVFKSMTKQQRKIYLEQGKAFMKYNREKDVGWLNIEK